MSRFKKPNTSDPFALFVGRSKSLKKKKNAQPLPLPEKTVDEKRAHEDEEMLAKSRKILEAKAKLYEKMKNSGGSLNSDDTCLVRFNQKKQDERPPVQSSSESDSDDGDRKAYSDDEDDKWTEYTDVLGRTRKCLKEDVDFFKRKDRDLAAAARNRSGQSEEANNSPTGRDMDRGGQTPWFIDTKGISSADLPLFKPSTDDDTLSTESKATKIEEMRQQWEQKEQDNLQRDNIHYQDVLFDEARTHGVGYYSFSMDAEERERQQKTLQKEREKTLDEQRRRDDVRTAREKLVADRVFAAKNRQRARLGLDPISREEYDAAQKPVEPEEKEEDPKQRKREEKERRKMEKLENKREQQRKQHLRAWDEGKDGTRRRRSESDEEQWTYKADKPEPMSQQTWNEIKRDERIPEFAPPATELLNRFTTIKPKQLKRRNEMVHENMFNAPIRNELDGDDFPIEDDESNKRRRAEVAPPATFDYYGPSSSTKPRQHTVKPDISESIEAGLRFLRYKSDKVTPGSKHSWVSNTTYDE